jgi:hypothetical protein
VRNLPAGAPLPGRARPWRVRAVALAAGIAGAGVLTACGSTSANSSAGSTASTMPPVSMATSLDTARDSWAVVPMSANPAFWQVFVRPASSATWQLVTPQGVADNGGLVAAGTGGSLTVAVRPSQGLTFSPLGGPGAIAGSPAGRKCGAVGVTDVSFGITEGQVLAVGTCGATGTTVFAHSASGWQRLSLPVSGRVVRMMPGLALAANGSRLYATWDTAGGWPVSPALPAAGVVAAGSFAPDGAWVLLPGHRAATIAGPGQPWRSLPAVPAGTVVLAAGPGGAVDALAVSGSNLTVWRLTGAAAVWSKIQKIGVPIQNGSSS